MITHVIFWHQLHKHYLFNKNAKIVTYLQLWSLNFYFIVVNSINGNSHIKEYGFLTVKTELKGRNYKQV